VHSTVRIRSVAILELLERRWRYQPGEERGILRQLKQVQSQLAPKRILVALAEGIKKRKGLPDPQTQTSLDR